MVGLGRGVLTLRQIRRIAQSGMEIQSEDNGPGITNVEQSFADGYSTTGVSVTAWAR